MEAPGVTDSHNSGVLMRAYQAANPMSSKRRTVPLASRLAATILAGAIWFAFVVLYLAFYAGNLDLWQRTAVFLASGVLVGAVIAVFWVTYGFKALESSED
jgi:hypothetical protein